jgi:hypothetical protein
MTFSSISVRRQPSALARLIWWAYYLVLRAAMGAAFFIAGVAGARWVGVWLTLPLAACAAAVVCGGVAMGFGRAGGRVSKFNRLAVIVLPGGLRIARGRLPSMFAWSAGLWSAVGMAGAIYGGLGSHGMHHGPVHAPALHGLFVASLFVDGACFVMSTFQAVKLVTPKSSVPRALAMMLAGLLALMIGGVGLWLGDFPWAGVLVAGVPPAIVGGFYVWFILVRIATRQ